MKNQKIKEDSGREVSGIIFIGNYCYDLLLSAAGILAKIGHFPYVIDAGDGGELFRVLSGYGGRTDRIVTFRQTDFIRCNTGEELESFLNSKYQEKNRRQEKIPDIWIYMQPADFHGNIREYLEKKNYKKIVLADSFFHAVTSVINLVRQQHFQADLLLLRGLPEKKLSFSYFCKVYRKEFCAFKKVMELPWAEEDLAYRIRLDYEPSQGFMKLSGGYHGIVEEICAEAGIDAKQEIKKAFRTFEKNGR